MNTISHDRTGRSEASASVEDAYRAARRLDDWGSATDWTGADPYDGLNARRLRRACRSPLSRRILTQVVKRSPINLRSCLGIPPGLSPATLGLLASAYAKNGFLERQEARTKVARYVETLDALRSTAFAEPCWGYHFEVQTRVLFYPPTVPNTIATAFAALGLLDAYEFAGEERGIELALGAGEFFCRRVPQDSSRQRSLFWLPAGR